MEHKMEAFGAALAFVTLKAGTIIVAAVMAFLGFLLDTRKHSWPTALLAVITGVAMALVFTDAVSEYLHLGDDYRNAVAGVLGIGGRNLIMTISKLTRDPGLFLRIWRGQDDDENRP